MNFQQKTKKTFIIAHFERNVHNNNPLYINTRGVVFIYIMLLTFELVQSAIAYH